MPEIPHEKPPLRLLELTLPTPEENLALDEALLDEAEEEGRGEVLRIWEAARPFVVLGRSSRHLDEVDRAACRERDVPVLRRCSGGASIVAGPGCLMYAVVLDYERRPALRMLDEAHRFVLARVARAAARFADVAPRGTSDLAFGAPPRKFSGNSLRCKRRHLLYHGTLLYGFRLELIAECLRTAPRQPEYRFGREHAEFVANLPAAAGPLAQALIESWGATPDPIDWPRERTRQLVESRYGRAEWHEQL